MHRKGHVICLIIHILSAHISEKLLLFSDRRCRLNMEQSLYIQYGENTKCLLRQIILSFWNKSYSVYMRIVVAHARGYAGWFTSSSNYQEFLINRMRYRTWILYMDLGICRAHTHDTGKIYDFILTYKLCVNFYLVVVTFKYGDASLFGQIITDLESTDQGVTYSS